MSKDSSSFIIRKANATDAHTLAAFNIAMALETENKALNPDTVEQGVLGMINTASRGIYLVAEQQGTIQACTMITFEWSDWRNSNFWWIQSVYVMPECRRQGLFKKLYQTVKNLSIEDNACGIRLYVESENSTAQQTYQSLGMTACHYHLYEESLD